MLGFGVGSIVALFLMGAPIFVAFGLGSALIMLFVYHLTPLNIALKLFEEINSYVLLAGPLFIFAGNLLTEGGGVNKAVDFFDAWLGHLPGGLALVVVAFCAIFAAFTGTPEAAIVAIGAMMFPQMLKHGYSRSFSAGLITTGSLLGPIIPPSITMIIMASIMQISTGILFISGVIPGLIITLGLGVLVIVRSMRSNILLKKTASWKARGTTLVKALPFLIVPLIVLGGIYTGYFTPTEAATIACVLSIIIGFGVYRGLTWPRFRKIAVESAKTAGVIYIVLAGVGLFKVLLFRSGVGQLIAEQVVSAGRTPFIFVVALNIVVFILGFFIPPMATMVMLVPIIMPVVSALGINLYWFAIIWVINQTIATITPPFAFSIFISVRILKTPFEEVVKGIIPIIPVHLVVLILVIVFPEISLWLPKLGGMSV